jgi:hypothetical protein
MFLRMVELAARLGVNRSARFTVTDEYGITQPTGPIVVAADGSFSVGVPFVADRHGADANGRKYTIVVAANPESLILESLNP